MIIKLINMVKSMTGYGDASYSDNNIELKVEIKSINSKNLDSSFNMPRWLSCYEIKWRKIIENLLFRGKISICINLNLKAKTALSLTALPKETFMSNYNALKTLANYVNAETADLFRLALKYSYDNTDMCSTAEMLQKNTHLDIIKIIEDKLKEATEKCNLSRKEEGDHILMKFKEYLSVIEQNRQHIHELAAGRIEHIKSRIKTKLEMLKSVNYDTNRFEQELLYYIEKLDIEEEIVRLDKHLNLFLSTLSSNGDQEPSLPSMPKSAYPCGKKLGFILQEMNREANTISSKANDEQIQKSVVIIKEFIEKIKEQLFNVL